ncbi:hypothetical protein [Halobaculum gomorrense]|uniref:hypothetical protein n=1 Tax=Halobaculum gomorrense TaxID=43928 RepID=UPI000933BBB9|nr:hypothetical protein [Halobaculum gomorrense]
MLVPVFWLVQGGVLHAASALADGEGAFADTLAVAGWAGVIRTYGLADACDLSLGSAATVVGALTALGLVFELF